MAFGLLMLGASIPPLFMLPFILLPLLLKGAYPEELLPWFVATASIAVALVASFLSVIWLAKRKDSRIAIEISEHPLRRGQPFEFYVRFSGNIHRDDVVRISLRATPKVPPLGYRPPWARDQDRSSSSPPKRHQVLYSQDLAALRQEDRKDGALEHSGQASIPEDAMPDHANGGDPKLAVRWSIALASYLSDKRTRSVLEFPITVLPAEQPKEK